jgi:hypothetical protein
VSRRAGTQDPSASEHRGRAGTPPATAPEEDA